MSVSRSLQAQNLLIPHLLSIHPTACTTFVLCTNRFLLHYFLDPEGSLSATTVVLLVLVVVVLVVTLFEKCRRLC